MILAVILSVIIVVVLVVILVVILSVIQEAPEAPEAPEAREIARASGRKLFFTAIRIKNDSTRYRNLHRSTGKKVDEPIHPQPLRGEASIGIPVLDTPGRCSYHRIYAKRSTSTYRTEKKSANHRAR